MNTLILIVDDEQEILHLVETLLRDKGYGVVSASNAEDAIRAFQGLPQRPDLVLTDVVMPGVSGPMLAERLLVIDPRVRVLFMSGYDDRQVVRRYVVEQGYQLLPKPFNAKSLYAAVEAALDAGKNAGKS